MRLGEELGGAPQRSDGGAALEGEGVVGDLVEIGVGLLKCRADGGDVAVVEAPQVDAQLAHELKEGAHAALGDAHGVVALRVPRPALGGGAERVRPVVPDGVPEGDAEAEPLLHGLARHHLARVVVPEREGLVRVRTEEGDDVGNVGEEDLVVGDGARLVVRRAGVASRARGRYYRQRDGGDEHATASGSDAHAGPDKS